jgi:hypothetical protein
VPPLCSVSHSLTPRQEEGGLQATNPSKSIVTFMVTFMR